jgi:putrescine:ornithine antiporter
MIRPRTRDSGWPQVVVATGALALLAAIPLLTAQGPPAGVVSRIRDTGTIRLGYRADARPFSYNAEGAAGAAGYSIAVCQAVAEAMTRSGQIGTPRIEWVMVTPQERFLAVQQGRVDLLCGADTITLERRGMVAFSTPIFPGGIGVLLRADAPAQLRDVLAGKGPAFQPTWRASASQTLRSRGFAVVGGTTAERWLTTRLDDLQVASRVVPVRSYADGVEAVRRRDADALFGERAILLDAARRDAAGPFRVLDRLFTHEPLALAMHAGDADFRLMVDRALARLNASGQLLTIYGKWFGEPDASAVTFFQWNALSE